MENLGRSRPKFGSQMTNLPPERERDAIVDPRNLSAPKSRDFCACDCEFALQAGNRCDFRHLLNKETLRFEGSNFHR